MKAHYNPNSVRMPEKRTAVCNNGCKQEFDLQIFSEFLVDLEQFGRVERKYLRCPHCGHEYDIGYADKVVQALLDENDKLFATSKKQLLAREITPREYDMVQRKIKRNKQKGIDRMNKIERAYKALRKHEN